MHAPTSLTSVRNRAICRAAAREALVRLFLLGLGLSGTVVHGPHARGDAESGLSVGGLMFGDAYHIPAHHLPSGDGAGGAVLRRAYLTVDGEHEAGWFGRFRLEANQSGEFERYDFEVDVKDLYLGYAFNDQQLIAGLQPTPTFDVIEAAWGKRYLMRTPTDLQGLPSRDAGIALKGRINAGLG